jgi:hypothetical protein
MEFSLEDYLKYSKKANYFPQNFFPFVKINKIKYIELEKLNSNNNSSISNAFRELHNRVGNDYFKKVYRSQSSAFNFSQRSFPAYRFLLPEILVDDWLSIVDWHKKHCRDHALHQPLTAYIVHKLLGGGISNRSLKIGDTNLLDLCVSTILKWDKSFYLKEYLLELGIKPDAVIFQNNHIGRAFWKNAFFEIALVAAIFHDIGYPWQYINRLNSHLNSTSFSLNNSLANAEHIYSCFKNRLLLYPFNGYKPLKNSTPCNWEKTLLELISFSMSKTHGFPGAIGFLFLNDYIREFPSLKELPFHQFCIDWASVGIMMHDFKTIYHGIDNEFPPENIHMRLAFDRDPLSCVISLADLLEDFERPNVTLIKHNSGSTLNYSSSCKATEINANNEIINIIYKFENSKNAIEKKFF